MIKNANTANATNIAIPELKRPEFQINDSLFSDALERNKLTIPPRLMHLSLIDHPLSKPDDANNSDVT